MMKEKYGKFNTLQRTSLSNLIEKLSLIGNLEYSDLKYGLVIQKANKIDNKIENMEDFKKYFSFLKEEIDAREKKYLIELQKIHKRRNEWQRERLINELKLEKQINREKNKGGKNGRRDRKKD